MIARYLLLNEHIHAELQELERIVLRTEQALKRAAAQPADRDFFFASAALDLHGFYAGIEHLFVRIGNEVDGNQPAGARWHRDLLTQMTLAVPKIRPPVISNATHSALEEYLEFRHVVRNVYSFDLRLRRVEELAQSLQPTFTALRIDLEAFGEFLAGISTADED